MTTDTKGVLNFIDVDDKTQTVPLELNRCLMDAIAKVDFKKVPNATLHQPIFLHSRKR